MQLIDIHRGCLEGKVGACVVVWHRKDAKYMVYVSTSAGELVEYWRMYSQWQGRRSREKTTGRAFCLR